jgi:PhnB protein
MSTTNNHTIVQPYLFFNGDCEQAVEFYRKAIGAQAGALMRFKDSPEPTPPGMLAPGYENKVMHTEFRVGETTIMASDGCGTEKTRFQGFSLALAVATEAEADRYFNALAAGGKVNMPLSKTFWSPRFGMLEDRFGIGWMINVVPKS